MNNTIYFFRAISKEGALLSVFSLAGGSYLSVICKDFIREDISNVCHGKKGDSLPGLSSFFVSMPIASFLFPGSYLAYMVGRQIVLRNKPILVFDEEGFAHERYGYYSWQEVSSIVIWKHFRSHVIGHTIRFKLQDDKFIDIQSDELKVSVMTFLDLINQFKQIHKPTYDQLWTPFF